MAYRDVVLADNPVAYWRLGEPSGTAADDLQSATNGTYVGGITLAQSGFISGDADTSVQFNGTTGYVNTNRAISFATTGKMSFEAWVNLASQSNVHQVWWHGDTASYDYQVGFANGYMYATFYETSGSNRGWLDTESVGTIVASGVTAHIVCTADETNGSICFYKDGRLFASNMVPWLFTSTVYAGSVLLGKRLESGVSTNWLGSGTTAKLDEVAIYDYVLSPARVGVHYAVGLQVGISALVLGGM